MTMTPYQQLEFMVENGCTVTIDCSYETSEFIISVSATSVGSWSFQAGTLPKAIEKACDKFSVSIGHTIGEDY